MKQFNWITIPIYNCLALTHDAIDSCLAQDIGDIRILCVLDKATDGVGPYLRSLHPRVQTIGMPGCGVTKAWNTALSHIFDFREAGAALVVNSDVKLRPDAYRLLMSDGGPFVTCVGTSSGAKFPGGVPSGKTRPHPDFSCFLIRKECWQKVGQFDEKMRLYTSDGDMHLRMHKAGIEAYCLDLPFWHYASGTLKQTDEADRERILKIAQDDRLAFFEKWGFDMGSPNYYKQFTPSEQASASSDARPSPLASES